MQHVMTLFAALSYLLAVASAASLPLARQATDITITGPFSLGINCTAVYTWTGGAPPFSAAFTNIDTPQNPVPFVAWSDIAEPRLEWTPQNNATGQLLELGVQDAEGGAGSFGFVVVSTQEVC